MAYTFDANAEMDQLLSSDDGDFVVYEPGDFVTGIVVGISKKDVLVDLEGKITGVISGKELNDVLGTLKELEIGQEVKSIVIASENDDGVLTLSLRKAGQLKAWDEFQNAYEEKRVIDVVPSSANKGGLLVDIAGIKAFIPVSQLSPENYPRVDDANANKILEKLQSLITKKLKVRVIGIDKEDGKLIFSEREAFSDKRKIAIKDLVVGSVVNGKVTGVVKFGVFVTFDELEGLIHISEIAWGHVKDPSHYARVGDSVEVKVIGIDGEKISLSMKQLQEDPWVSAVEKYKVGTVVKGNINKVSEFGAFVTLDDDVNGLIHLSEIDHNLVSDPNDYFKEGDEVEAKVIDIDIKEHRIALSTKELKEKKKEDGEEDKEEKDEKKGKEEKKAEKSEEDKDKKEEKVEKKAKTKKEDKEEKKPKSKEKKEDEKEEKIEKKEKKKKATKK